MLTENVLKSQAFKLKGRLFTFTVLQLLVADTPKVVEQLVNMIAQAPKMFENTPIVLDCSQVDSETIDLNSLYQAIREQGVLPVAIQGGSALLQTCAQTLGLASLNSSMSSDKPLMETPFEPTVAAITPILKSKRVASPIRSGQQVVSRSGDLIITAAVSCGAEVLSDGSIHIYGPLRGKALAGINGDKEARIYCQSLDAELLSIAGFYLVRDAMEPHKAPCQIYLQDDQIKIELL